VLNSTPEGVPKTFAAFKKASLPIFTYDNFITISINFILLAFVIFQMVKVISRVRLLDVPPQTPNPKDVVLLHDNYDSRKNNL